MSDYKVTDSELTGIANAIRTKGGNSSPLVFPNGFTSAIEAIPTSSGIVQPLSVTQDGTYTPPSGVDGYAPVVVNVSSSEFVGFDLYTADSKGNDRSHKGIFDNNYLVCFFHDNMDSYYNLNGVRHDFSVSMQGMGKGNIFGDAVSVVNPVSNYSYDGEIIQKNGHGSLFTCHHDDSGSYISVIGGWVGYPSGGSIYKQAVHAALNSITMNSAHETLLIFVGASDSAWGSADTIDINGNTYEITNIGTTYDHVKNAYGVLKINNNTSSIINVTFPVLCFNFVAIIGIDS